MPPPPAFPHRADEPPLESVHACFVAMLEGEAAEAERFDPAVRELAARLLTEHRGLERAGLPEPSPADTGGGDLLACGQRVGQYEIELLLGRGAIGEVYAAREAATGRRVALKMLPQAMSRSLDARIDREVRALAALEHPGIARLYASAVVEVDGTRRRAIAMELVRGAQTLAEWHASAAPSRTRCIEAMAAIADAVAYAHGRGVIHCDLKPGNILVDEDGRAVVIDFGISRIVEQEGDPRATVSLLGSRVAGTLAYIAPESLDAGAASDVRADIHALGAILYELLAQRPFRSLEALSLPQRLARIASDAPPRLRDANRSLQGDLDRIVTRCTDPDPARRYASASQLAADLRAHLAGRPVLPELQGRGERLRRAVSRHRGAVALGAFVAALLVATTIVSLRFARDARRDARLANLAAAARAIDAADQLPLAQHARALGPADGTPERELIDRVLAMQGTPLLLGDWYEARWHPDGRAVFANGHFWGDGAYQPSVLARFDVPAEGRAPVARWHIPAGESLVHGMAITPDGATIVDFASDGALRAVRADDGAVLESVPVLRGTDALSIALRSDGLVAAARAAIELRRLGSLAELLAEIDPGVGPVRAMAFSPGSPDVLAVAGQDGAALVDLATGVVTTRFETPAGFQVATCWNADGTRVYFAGWDRTLRAYDPARAAPLWTARGHRDSIWSIERLRTATAADRGASGEPAEDAATAILASAGADGTLRLWNAHDGAPLAAIPVSTDVVWSIEPDPAGRGLLTVARGESRLTPLARIAAWAGQPGRDHRIAHAPSGARATPRPDGSVLFESSAATRTLHPSGGGPVDRVALSNDGALLAALRRDGTIALVSTGDGAVRWATDALRAEDAHEPNGIPALAVDARGGRVLVASRTFRCVALSLADGSRVWTGEPEAQCVAVAASPDGLRVYAADRDGMLARLDGRDGRLVTAVRRLRTRATCLLVSDDQTRVFAGFSDGSLHVLDADTLEEVLFIGVSPAPLRSLWLSDDGFHLVDREGVERVR